MAHPIPIRAARASRLFVVSLACASFAWPLLSSASSSAQQPARHRSEIVFLSGPAEVAADHTIDTLIVLEGPTRVAGTITGDLVALGGDVDVAGTVGGTVTAFSGAVRLAPGASVGGDVAAPSAPVLGRGARIGGEVRPLVTHVPAETWLLGRLTTWIAVTVSLFVLALLLAWMIPRSAAEAVDAAARQAPGRSFAVGILVVLVLPAMALMAIATVLAAPLGVALLLAIIPVAAAGYVTSGWVLGRRIAERGSHAIGRWPAVAQLLLGLGLLRLAALVPMLHVVLWVALSAFGAGAAVLALARARGSMWRPRSPQQPQTEPPPTEPSVITTGAAAPPA